MYQLHSIDNLVEIFLIFICFTRFKFVFPKWNRINHKVNVSIINSKVGIRLFNIGFSKL